MKTIIVNPTWLEQLRAAAEGPMFAPMVLLFAVVATAIWASWATSRR